MKKLCIKNSKIAKGILILFLIGLINGGCKKLIEVDPPISAIVGKDIYKTDAMAASVLTGIYGRMSSQFKDLSVKMGAYSDELSSIENFYISPFYRNDILKDQEGDLFWKAYYDNIFYVNSAIEGIGASNTLTGSVKNQLLGEAKFLRGFFYFYLTNLYGDVPLLLTTDPEVNRLAERKSVQVVYQQIITDLKEAQDLISNNFLDGALNNSSGDRRRPNRATVAALLARVYLFNNQWSLAEGEATKVIGDGRFSLESLDKTFLISSKEAIWQLQLTQNELNTLEANYFVLKATNTGANPGPDYSRPVYLSDQIYNTFEANDQRKAMWTDTVEIRENATGIVKEIFPFPYKYKVWLINQPKDEYLIVMRLAEQYLIRAEARARQGNLQGGEEDLFQVRNRAGLGKLLFNSPEDAVNKILDERRSELFSEFSHRWFDLRRTDKLNQVMSLATPKKGGVWQLYKALLPIPIKDLNTNPNLKGHQNPGYVEN